MSEKSVQEILLGWRLLLMLHDISKEDINVSAEDVAQIVQYFDDIDFFNETWLKKLK